jgi:sugar phosphate isomerase/epimerase
MNLALSNLAWNKTNEAEVFEKMNAENINNAEIVFPKNFDWNNINNEILLEFSKKLKSYNIRPSATQSIFFGTDIIAHEKTRISSHIKRVIDISSALGINTVVFGSPGLRKDFSSLTDVIAEIDEYIADSGIIFCIEPNCSLYTGNFFHTLEEIGNFIEHAKFKNIRTMIDTHNLIYEKEKLEDSFLKWKSLISHIHVSEIGLKRIEDLKEHEIFAEFLRKEEYSGLITYEIVEPSDLDLCLKEFASIYG